MHGTASRGALTQPFGTHRRAVVQRCCCYSCVQLYGKLLSSKVTKGNKADERKEAASALCRQETAGERGPVASVMLRRKVCGRASQSSSLLTSSLGDSPASFCSFSFPQSKSIKQQNAFYRAKDKEMQPSKTQAKVHLAWDEYWTTLAGSEDFSESQALVKNGPCH